MPNNIVAHSSQQFSNCKMKIFFEAEKKIDLKFPDELSNMCMRVCSQKRNDDYNGDKIIKLSSIGLIDILCAAILFHGLLFFPNDGRRCGNAVVTVNKTTKAPNKRFKFVAIEEKSKPKKY